MKHLIALAMLALLPLCACSEVLTEGTSDAAGLAGAGIAGAVTKDATVGAAIGLGVKSVADLGLHFAERRVHGAEQDNIAAAAGALPAGGTALWSVSHSIPIESDKHGAVYVTRVFSAQPPGGLGFTCKEIVFSVDGEANAKTAAPGPRSFYLATVCLDGTQWKWASAEPATSRWGSLQ